MGALEKAIMQRRRNLLEQKELTEWSVDEVARWVESIGYPQYSENFRENHISGGMLQKVDMDVLRRELKIMSYGVRSKILEAVKNVLSPSSISAQKSMSLPPFFFLSQGSTRKTHIPPSIKKGIGNTIVTIDYDELHMYETLGKGEISLQMISPILLPPPPLSLLCGVKH